MVRKVFCIYHTFMHATTSPLIIDQNNHDEYENNINALKSHICLFFGCKDKGRIRNVK
jgi:hypothetical protein